MAFQLPALPYAFDALEPHIDARTMEILEGLADPEFDRIVDRNWDPPVTAAVRLVSVVNDVTQHLGQVAYVRGLLNARS